MRRRGRSRVGHPVEHDGEAPGRAGPDERQAPASARLGPARAAASWRPRQARVDSPAVAAGTRRELGAARARRPVRRRSPAAASRSASAARQRRRALRGQRSSSSARSMPVIRAGVDLDLAAGRVGSTTVALAASGPPSRCLARAAPTRASSSRFSSAARDRQPARARSAPGSRSRVGASRTTSILLAAQPARARAPGQHRGARPQPRGVVTAQPDPRDRTAG